MRVPRWAILTVVTLTCACSAAHGRSPASAPPSTATPSARPASSVPAARHTVRPGPDTALAARLEPAPAGTSPWTTAWGRTEYPSVSQYVRALYAPANREGAQSELVSSGVIDMVHRTWSLPNGDGFELLLMRFASGDEATTRYLRHAGGDYGRATRIDLRVGRRFSAHVAAYEQARRTSDGLRVVAVDGYVGSVTIEAYYFAQSVDTPALSRWIDTQLRRL